MELLADNRADVEAHLRRLGWIGGQEPVGALDDGDPGAEASEHLRELAADEPAAHHDEVLGQPAQLEDRPRRQVGDGVETVHPLGGVASAGVEEDPVGLELGAVHRQPAGTDEDAVALDQVEVVGPVDGPVGAGPGRLDDPVLRLDHGGQIYGQARVDADAELPGPAGPVSELGVAIGELTQRIEELEARARTVAVVVADGTLLDAVASAHPVEPDTAETVAGMRRRGIQPVILTGDDMS